MRTIVVTSAFVRPHFSVGCWCGTSATCECCGGPAHIDVDIAPDNQYRMAAFGQLGLLMPV